MLTKNENVYLILFISNLILYNNSRKILRKAFKYFSFFSVCFELSININASTSLVMIDYNVIFFQKVMLALNTCDACSIVSCRQ